MPHVVRTRWRKKILMYLSLSAVLAAAALSGLLWMGRADVGRGARAGAQPIALVLADDHGPSGCNGCADAAEHMLKQSKWNFNIVRVGPDGETLTPELLKSAALYVQPGGNDNVDDATAELQAYGKKHGYDFAASMRTFVENGGRYLGLCMGGYLAGTPGFDLLKPGNSNQFITSPGASVMTDKNTIVDVNWRDQLRNMFFQDGPYFVVPDESKANVLARYTNNEIAVMITADGKGEVGVSGPHPEATADWYDTANPPLPKPPGLNVDLANDLLDTLMQ